MSKRYVVTATRERDWWVLRFPDLGGASQARRLDQAEAVARDYIHGMTDEQPDSFDVDIDVDLTPDVRTLVSDALAAKADAIQRQEVASQLQRQAVRTLAESGYTVRDIGRILGLTFQRVSQLRAGQ